MALTSCTVPAAGRPTFTLGEDEIEFGIGIHGEPGRSRNRLGTAHELADLMAAAVIDDLPFRAGDSVVVIVNGMGGTPLIELYLLYHEIERICAARGLKIARRLVGNLITSLEMQGWSLTLVRVDADMVSLWDDPIHTAAFRWGC